MIETNVTTRTTSSHFKKQQRTSDWHNTIEIGVLSGKICVVEVMVSHQMRKQKKMLDNQALMTGFLHRNVLFLPEPELRGTYGAFRVEDVERPRDAQKRGFMEKTLYYQCVRRVIANRRETWRISCRKPRFSGIAHFM